MKKPFDIIFIFLLIFLLTFSCKRKKYKYEIHGKIYIPTNGTSGLHDAIWYTDTINFDGDTIYYFNSDGTEERITPPYILIDKSLDNK